MNKVNRFLVVGGDSLIGTHLAEQLKKHGEVISTTRRNSVANQISLDLESLDIKSLLSLAPDIVFICAGLTNIKDCEADPQGARRINVEGTLSLAKAMVSIGCFVVFLSSNTVFNCLTPYPNEDLQPSPQIEYGKQKVDTETGLLSLSGATDHVAIVRLSKVVTGGGGVAGEFIRRLKNREQLIAFEDLLLSPVTLEYVCESLIDIALRRLSGIFHISGNWELSYAEFATKLAEAMNVSTDRILPSHSDAVGINVIFRPRHPALGMSRTRQILGRDPQPLSAVINQLLLVKYE
jgi:dTDP-4-dehydrorhamnose reductase